MKKDRALLTHPPVSDKKIPVYHGYRFRRATGTLVEDVKQELQERDVMLALSVTVVIAATLKFLLEGVAIEIAGKWVSMGHVDATIYAALLTPVLGAHSYLKSRKIAAAKLQKADNPDAN